MGACGTFMQCYLSLDVACNVQAGSRQYKTVCTWCAAAEYTYSALHMFSCAFMLSCVLSCPPPFHMLVQVVDAVAYLHSLGILHRDIKPENCLLAKPAAHYADKNKPVKV